MIASFHIRVVIIESAAVCVAVIELVSSPEICAITEIAGTSVVPASRHGGKTGSIIGIRVVAYCTGVGTVAPTCCGGHGFRYVTIDLIANILDIASHIVGQLLPFCIAWHMPAVWAYSLNMGRIAVG